MSNDQSGVQDIFIELSNLSLPGKMLYLEHFLFYLTLASRAIWSDDNSSDHEKVEALKWLNELSHRVWNIRADLQQKQDDNSIWRLYDNIKFYGEQSLLLQMQLVPILAGAFGKFKQVTDDN